MTAEISQEAVERMVALVRQLAGTGQPWEGLSATTEARRIVALLPDPNNIEARQIASDVLIRLGASSELMAASDIRMGNGDDMIVMHVARECLTRGRELALKARDGE